MSEAFYGDRTIESICSLIGEDSSCQTLNLDMLGSNPIGTWFVSLSKIHLCCCVGIKQL